MRHLPGGRVLAALVIFVLVAGVLAFWNGPPWLRAAPSPTGLPGSAEPGASAVAGPGSAAPGSAQPGTGGPGSSPIDTADWQLVRLHSLGYSIQLPPTFELVGGDDPSNPVPSYALINSIAPQIASGLKDQAARLSTAPGVFGELGLWGVEPDSLSQVGLLAGEPYRVAASDLQTVVQTSVSSRATPLEGSTVDQVSLPAGDGYLAIYRDSVDLGAHLEIHLRTPNGRYLVLVMTFITPTVDDSAVQRFLAVAGTLAPLAGDDFGRCAGTTVTVPGRARGPGPRGIAADHG